MRALRSRSQTVTAPNMPGPAPAGDQRLAVGRDQQGVDRRRDGRRGSSTRLPDVGVEQQDRPAERRGERRAVGGEGDGGDRVGRRHPDGDLRQVAQRVDERGEPRLRLGRPVELRPLLDPALQGLDLGVGERRQLVGHPGRWRRGGSRRSGRWRRGRPGRGSRPPRPCRPAFSVANVAMFRPSLASLSSWQPRHFATRIGATSSRKLDGASARRGRAAEQDERSECIDESSASRRIALVVGVKSSHRVRRLAIND